MKDVHPISFFLPIAVGSAAVICTFLIHALPLSATINFVLREEKLGQLGTSLRKDMAIFFRTILYSFMAHLFEIAFWATVFLTCGEFSDFDTAFYHSAVNYTSLGYGDIIMSPSWRLLGPLETADGMLLFGVSTAMIFAMIQRLVGARYADLKN